MPQYNKKQRRQSSSRKGYPGPTIPQINPRQFQQSYQIGRRVPSDLLRAAMKTSPVRRAVDRVADGIFAMNFSVLPPKGKEDSDKMKDLAEKIEYSILHPNEDDDQTYYSFLYKVVSEMFCLGFACVEKRRGTKEKPFWMWVADGDRIHINPDWESGKKVPKYFEYGMSGFTGVHDHVPFMDDEMFVIQKNHSTYQMVPESPVEVAFPHLCAWLGLHNFQYETTSKATSQYILNLGDISREALDAFRQYWKEEIEGTGNTPITAGPGGVQVEKVGAENDSGLFHQYDEVLLRRIAVAFNLTARDFGLTDHDNRATAGIAADSAFQEAILPYAYCLVEALNIHIISPWFPGFKLEINDTEPRTETQEGQLASTLYEKGLISLNEARRQVGRTTLENGNIFKNGGTIDDPRPPQQREQQEQPNENKPLKDNFSKEKRDQGAKNEQSTIE